MAFGFIAKSTWGQKLTERPNRGSAVRRPTGSGNFGLGRRRPFWLPASNFYILAAAVAIATFFLVWGILHDGADHTPWVPAGISASVVLVAAVFLREIVLRRARNRFMLVQRRLDYNLDTAAVRTSSGATESRKLSIEKNGSLIRAIQLKSEAARVLMTLGEGHYEVFEMCRAYLEVNKRELDNAGVGSPRLVSLLKGRKTVEDIQKFHLLIWAEIESKHLTLEARNRSSMTEKTDNAQKAVNVIRLALDYYPEETRLRESEKAVSDFLISLRVGHFIERAERSAFKGHRKRAVSHYKDALFFLARETTPNHETEALAEQINEEIRKLLEIPTSSKNLGTFDEND